MRELRPSWLAFRKGPALVVAIPPSIERLAIEAVLAEQLVNLDSLPGRDLVEVVLGRVGPTPSTRVHRSLCYRWDLDPIDLSLRWVTLPDGSKLFLLLCGESNARRNVDEWNRGAVKAGFDAVPGSDARAIVNPAHTVPSVGRMLKKWRGLASLTSGRRLSGRCLHTPLSGTQLSPRQSHYLLARSVAHATVTQ